MPYSSAAWATRLQRVEKETGVFAPHGFGVSWRSFSPSRKETIVARNKPPPSFLSFFFLIFPSTVGRRGKGDDASKRLFFFFPGFDDPSHPRAATPPFSRTHPMQEACNAENETQKPSTRHPKTLQQRHQARHGRRKHLSPWLAWFLRCFASKSHPVLFVCFFS